MTGGRSPQTPCVAPLRNKPKWLLIFVLPVPYDRGASLISEGFLQKLIQLIPRKKCPERR
jgi:hypothetical protein